MLNGRHRVGPVLLTTEKLDLLRRYAHQHERSVQAEIRVAIGLYLRSLQQREGDPPPLPERLTA